MKNKITLSFVFLLTIAFAFAQEATAPLNWFHMDVKKDKYPGVSSQKAYDELLKGKTAKTVTVAVIDGGTDVSQEDLKDIVWINKGEIPGNQIDDDQNGYVDDVNGWNFIGGKDSNVAEDNLELTRMYAGLKTKFKDADTNTFNASEKADYANYQSIRKKYKNKAAETKKMTGMMKTFMQAIANVKETLHTDTPSLEQIKGYKAASIADAYPVQMIGMMMEKGMPFKEIEKQFKDGYEYYEKGDLYSYNTEFDSRIIVGDHYDNVRECCYGNNRLGGPNGEHGTHVAGIIGAMRNNRLGIDGVADHVRIMVLRVVPDGDERDKDVANAIRYAADNGASVINMSFGKEFSPNKSVVDDAVRYAVSKDVLLVHAAGNDAKNTDEENNFPRDQYLGSDSTAASWIEVGASNWKQKKDITADFSNYGKNNVDLFAPGVDIYSTLPGNTYGSYDGTSMAGPVTAGVASIIRAYYPGFTAVEVKEILMKSVTPVKGKVYIPGTKQEKTKMKELCVTGGIVNAYNAVKLAESRSKGK